MKDCLKNVYITYQIYHVSSANSLSYKYNSENKHMQLISAKTVPKSSSEKGQLVLHLKYIPVRSCTFGNCLRLWELLTEMFIIISTI